MSFLSRIFGDANERTVRELHKTVEQINAFEPAISALSDEELKAKTQEFRDRITAGATLDELLPETFAVVREAGKRALNQRHFDVQLVGGMVLHQGKIAEMRTGEGKTLTATLPVYLNALAGKGVHVVTVNDYLARRDALWMGKIYDFLGMSVGIIQHQGASFRYDAAVQSTEAAPVEPFIHPCSRQESYACDITYGTNNEFGFDYLRDNMVHRLAQMAQRPYFFAIVDEIDSILIDEARTPLIISAPAEEATQEYYTFAKLVAQLTKDQDYQVDEKLRAATLTDAGIAKMEQWLGMENIYVEGGLKTVHMLESALRAYALFHRDRDYVVKDGEVIIVDEFTGRLMPGRRYNQGLHQAIEAKEGVKIQQESQTLGTVTFQNLFRMYPKLAGMTGTAATEAEEFNKIYKLDVVVIPTNKNNIRVDHADKIYRTEEGKFRAVVADVKEKYELGRPVLIGTISIDKNEYLSSLLEREGIKHEVLNAKNHAREADIIAQAGRPGSVTLATNMAGRGVDIILGGTPPNPEEAKKIRELGGLYVIGTERHESRRIDNQLRGRAARQGDPGETQFYVSTEDDLMRIFSGDRMKNVMTRLKLPEDMPISHPLISRALENAQKKVESNNFDTRKHLLEYDDVLNKHREAFYRRRRQVLEASMSEEGLEPMVKSYITEEMDTLLQAHANIMTPEGALVGPDELLKEVAAVMPVDSAWREQFVAAWDDANEARMGKLAELLKTYAVQVHTGVVAQFDNPEGLRDLEKSIMLRAMDMLWVEHLETMDYLRAGIGLQGYGQRDPLVEYRREGHRLYSELFAFIRKDIVHAIYKVHGAIEAYNGLLDRRGVQLQGAAKTMENASGSGAADAVAAAGAAISSMAPVDAAPRDDQGNKIGRNDPCFCGSGKKYKKCHGA